MRSALLGFVLLVASVAAPRAAVADVIDDFTLVGGGYTVTFTEPGTALIMDHPHGVYLFDSVSASINGVPGYEGNLQLLVTGGIGLPPVILILPGLPVGFPNPGTLELFGPMVASFTVVPISNPTFGYPDDLAVTIDPGVYSYGGAPGYTLTITEDPASVTPEPGTFALLSTGLAGGFALLRRTRVRRT